ncbi:MAG TPA: FAD-dependent oxidoreductase [Casimicrobiaceae bacterium]|nr:FAD-dependent oxidoreductase [Casimicrobiaceae bacterium]
MRVVIVGGGVFGCCIAYELARSGASVSLIERDPIGAHASGRNPGNLNPILGAAPELVPFALESFRLHQSLARELGSRSATRYALDPVRRVLLALDENDDDELAAVAHTFAGHRTFATARLRTDALREIEPRLAANVRGGLLIEGNYSLDSRAFHVAIAAAARQAGAEFIGARATGITSHAGSVSAVRTASGDYACDVLVLATGPWVAETRAWLDVDLAVAPVKGEMLRLRLRGRNISHDFTHGLISLYRRGDDEVWVGVTREHAGFDESATASGRRALIDGAARIMPAIREAEAIEHLAALRPMTRSALPIVTRATGWNNVFVANGGGIKGMLLAPGVGAAVRDLIVKGATALPLPDPIQQGVL